MRPTKSVKVGKDWITLKKGEIDYGRTGKKARQDVFKRWPHVTLCRPGPSYKGINKAYRVICGRDGCAHTKTVSKLRKQKHPYCFMHAGLYLHGIPVRAPHIQRRYKELVHAQRKRTGGYQFFIRCINAGCAGLVDISAKEHQKRAHCRPCAYIRDRELRIEAAVRRQKTLPGVVAYKIYKKTDGRTVKMPMCRCSAPDCRNLINWTPRFFAKYGHNRNCKSCHGNKRRLRPFEGAFNIAKKNAAKRSIPFTLTYKAYIEILGSFTCHYCATSLPVARFDLQVKLPRNHATSWLDRKVNEKGYTKQNCVACCVSCNMTKFRLVSYEEMLVLGAARAGQFKLARKRLLAHASQIAEHGQQLVTSKTVVLNQPFSRLTSPASNKLDFNINRA